MPAFDTAVLSSPGGREHNEDSCGFRSGCWVLADGLGGHAGGALASRTAVDAALASFEINPSPTAEALASHIAAANQAVLDVQEAQPELASMRTTLVMLAASDTAALWAHAGDSRLYHFRAGALLAQTKDHSVPQRLADAGEIPAEQIRFHEDRNRLLRSLGKPDPGATVLAEPAPLAPGDAFLLASDGFWEWVLEAQMEADLQQSATAAVWLGKLEARLRQAAQPGHDNYSAIAILCVP